MNNEKLIEQLRLGSSQEALKELYKSFPAIRNFIKTHGGNDDDAKDIFQESLLIFYRKIQSDKNFQLSAAVGTYLFSVAKYLWKDALKKKNREVSFITNDIPFEDTNVIEQEEIQMKILDQVLAKLGEKCTQILTLFYYQKKSMEEIANDLDYKTVDTAKTQKYKCLERAKIMVNELIPIEEKQRI